jgi:hypothetical protein
MNRAIIRFSRSHADDDEIVQSNSIGHPDEVDYYAQLAGELNEAGISTEGCTLLHYDDGKGVSSTDIGIDNDTYLLYVMGPTRCETREQLAKFLQHRAYEMGGMAGFFQIIAILRD